MNFRKDNDIIEWLLSGKTINRPLKEWERRAVQRKIMHLRADAAERENFAFRTRSDKSARTAEAGAKAMRMKADQLELIAKKLKIINRKPTMENKIKISKKQLKRIIKEEREKLMLEYADMSDPRLITFQKDLDAAFFNAIQAGIDISALGQVAEQFMASMGYEG